MSSSLEWVFWLTVEILSWYTLSMSMHVVLLASVRVFLSVVHSHHHSCSTRVDGVCVLWLYMCVSLLYWCVVKMPKLLSWQLQYSLIVAGVCFVLSKWRAEALRAPSVKRTSAILCHSLPCSLWSWCPVMLSSVPVFCIFNTTCQWERMFLFSWKVHFDSDNNV